MFCQVGLLCEALITARLLADEGTLASVHSQVVKEVVPLPKEHLASAIFVIALEYLYLAHCARVFVTKDAEGASRWHCLLYLDRAKVEIEPRLYVDLGVFGHLAEHLGV